LDASESLRLAIHFYIPDRRRRPQLLAKWLMAKWLMAKWLMAK
jgi:hypothetical protein